MSGYKIIQNMGYWKDAKTWVAIINQYKMSGRPELDTVQTSEDGYLTCKLVEVVQHIEVFRTNCGTIKK